MTTSGSTPASGPSSASPYNAPGMLVWYRNTQYGNHNHTTIPIFELPSTGRRAPCSSWTRTSIRCGGPAGGGRCDTSTLNNIQSRPQSSNAAFSGQETYGFTECLESPDLSYDLFCTKFKPQQGVEKFTENEGWYPGVEIRAEGFFRGHRRVGRRPVADNMPYTTRIVDANGKRSSRSTVSTCWDGRSSSGQATHRTGTTCSTRTTCTMGVIFEISKIGKGNTLRPDLRGSGELTPVR